MKISSPLFLTVGLIGTIAISVLANPLDDLRGRYAEAANDLERVIKINPGDVNATNQLQVVCQNPTKAPFQDAIDRADGRVEAEDWAGAEKIYTEAIAISPQNPYGWSARAFVRGEQKNFTGAIADNSSCLTCYELTGAETRKKTSILMSRSYNWLDSGDPLRAFVDAFAATEADPNYETAWMARADALYAMGNLDQAVACFNRAAALSTKVRRSFTQETAKKNEAKYLQSHRPMALELDEAQQKAKFQEAVKAQKAGQNADALQKYTDIIDADPFDGPALGNRGLVHYVQGHMEAAISDFSTAIIAEAISHDLERQPIHLYHRANTYSKLGRIPEAINDLELAVKIDPKYTNAIDSLKAIRQPQRDPVPVAPKLSPEMERAVSLYAEAVKAGKAKGIAPRDEAQKIVDAILATEPNNIPALLLRGKTGFLYRYVLFDAMEYFDRAVAADPKNPNVWYERAHVWYKRFGATAEEHSKAIEDLKQAIKLGRSDTDTRLELAGHLVAIKDLAAAVEQVEILLKEEPKNPRLLMDHILLLEKQEKWSLAIADWTLVIALHPSPPFYAHRGDDYIEARQYAEAIQDFDTAIEQEPKLGDHYVGRARARRLKGDKAGALADYTRAHELDSTLPAVKPDLSDADKAEAARKKVNRRAADDEIYGGSIGPNSEQEARAVDSGGEFVLYC